MKEYTLASALAEGWILYSVPRAGVLAEAEEMGGAEKRGSDSHGLGI